MTLGAQGDFPVLVESTGSKAKVWLLTKSLDVRGIVPGKARFELNVAISWLTVFISGALRP